MATVRLHRAVPRVPDGQPHPGIVHTPVVPVKLRKVPPLQRLASLARIEHFADVPQAHRLVLPVGDEVEPIPLGVDVGDALSVAQQNPHGGAARGPQNPPVPHLAHAVVAAGEEDVGGGVGVAHGVHVVAVAAHAHRHLPGVHVQQAQRRVPCAHPRRDLPPVVRELQRPDALAAVEPALVGPEVERLVDVGDVGDGGGARAGHVHHVHDGRDGGVHQPPLVRREAGVRDGPPQASRLHLLPQLEVGLRIVEANALVLEAPDKGVPLLIELTNVGLAVHLVHDAALGGQVVACDMAAL
mmetsp:Transcript_22609/g.49541  ORF Transcript_22609/g.49541 Transcript_22609/m.49541 type:complete len:298 (-) Transcript_22609:199-1092(-)